jgi:hypothetical protein
MPSEIWLLKPKDNANNASNHNTFQNTDKELCFLRDILGDLLRFHSSARFPLFKEQK